MGKCLPCSGIPSTAKGKVARLKKEYEAGKSDFYVYRLKTNGSIKFVSKSSFNIIFNKDIKPNFKNGAEYFHISEFSFDK